MFVVVFFVAGGFAWFAYEIREARRAFLAEIDAQADRQIAALEKHQKWLFEQLYSVSPGKVLAPDELEPEEVSAPATVYSPTEDPMSEFNGMRDDFHG